MNKDLNYIIYLEKLLLQKTQDIVNQSIEWFNN